MYRKEKKNNPNWRLLKFVQQSRGARALFIVPTNHKDTQHTNTRQNSNFEKTNFSPATGHTLHVLRWICSHLNIIWLVLKSSFFLFLFANTYICRIKYWMKQCNVYQYNIIIYIYIDKIHTYICRSQNFCSYKNENDCKMLMYCFFFLSLILRTRKYSTKNEPLFVNEK